MKADKFNALYEKLLVRPLLSAGFSQKRNHLFFVKETGALMFMRRRDKWSALCQDTHFTVCVRHTFLSDLERQPKIFSDSIYDYPFKIQPSRMTPDFFCSKWHYESFNEMGRWPDDIVEFGRIADAVPYLTELCGTLLNVAIQWLDFLHPAEAHRQIKRYGKADYCEKIWLKDYERYLATK